jgi:hypothetical protein
LCVGWGFESGFSGFRGFLRVGVGWDGACRSIKCKRKYPFILIADAMIAAAKY